MAEPLARHSLEALTQLMLRQPNCAPHWLCNNHRAKTEPCGSASGIAQDRAAEQRERLPSRSTKDSTPAGAAGSVMNWTSEHIDQCTSDRAPGEAMALVSRTKPTG